MADYILSNTADNDLRKIYRYTLEEFGAPRASAYLQSLDECFQMLTTNPNTGKDISHIRAGYLQFNHDHHRIFYQKDKNDIFIVRVLHGAMAIERHL